MKRTIQRKVQGFETRDGAGVRLVRVLGHDTVEDFDPFLMLDSFDSCDPKDYIRGFPMHPHRGIETITYLVEGEIQHEDSLGNQDTIHAGDAQWMNSGSGILHEEMPQANDRMLGVQLWLNLPKDKKMSSPAYHALKQEGIQRIPFEGGVLRLISGFYGEHQAFQGDHVPVNFYDISLDEGSELTLETQEDHQVVLFTLQGDLQVEEEYLPEKTAANTSEGQSITLRGGKQSRVLVLMAPLLREPIAWGGPIVMNSQEELRQAFDELRRGTFIKEA